MKRISRTVQPDGSVVCRGGVDPTRTATFAGPLNSASQQASVASFYAAEPDDGITEYDVQAALAVAMPIVANTPVPATSAPPAVADSGAQGTEMQKFALADHTHASKARKARLQTAADGTLTWTYSTPFASGVVPRICAVAETASGTTDVYNVQIVGTPTNTSASVLVNRVQRSVVSLIGLTVLSVPASPGATWVHLLALEP